MEPFSDDTAFTSMWTRQGPDVDSVRTAKEREGRGEKGKMEKNTMKWLSRLRLPKSFHAPIRRAEAKKESTPRLLFAQQPNPAGRQEKRGKSVGRLGLDRRLV